MKNCYEKGCFALEKKVFQKKVQVFLCNVMSSASESPVMTFAVAVLDQQTTYNGLTHKGQQYQNQRAIIFGRQSVPRKASMNRREFS